jgi:hypothetical protein
MTMEEVEVLTLLEGLRDIIITEATQPESPRDFTVLLCHRLARRESVPNASKQMNKFFFDMVRWIFESDQMLE